MTGMVERPVWHKGRGSSMAEANKRHNQVQHAQAACKRWMWRWVAMAGSTAGKSACPHLHPNEQI